MTPGQGNNREHAIQDCLDQIHAEGSQEAALDNYPNESDLMRLDLEAACWLDGHRQALQPRPGFVPASRRRLLTRIATAGPSTPVNRLRWTFASLRFPSIRRKFIPRLALIYLLLVSFLLCAGRISRASLTWLPGDIGYPLKTVMEDFAVFATPTAAGDARLHIEFAHRRTLEAQALVLEGRYEYIPATVANFSRQVDQAVGCVDRLAGKDRSQAYRLALELERVLNQQTPMVVLLSGFTPEGARPDFERVLTIAEGGLSDVQKVLESGEGGAGLTDGAVTLGAVSNWANHLAYSIVRGRPEG
jgi:Domain of unknown function (DUF5667)